MTERKEIISTHAKPLETIENRRVQKMFIRQIKKTSGGELRTETDWSSFTELGIFSCDSGLKFVVRNRDELYIQERDDHGAA